MGTDTGYEAAFRARLEAAAPGAALSRLQCLPEDVGRAALREILETGCLSQNIANIELARRAIAQVDPDWLAAALPEVVPTCLFRDPEWREWELRRLSEMLRGEYAVRQFPAAFRWLMGYAGSLRDPEVDEALADICGETEYE